MIEQWERTREVTPTVNLKALIVADSGSFLKAEKPSVIQHAFFFTHVLEKVSWQSGVATTVSHLHGRDVPSRDQGGVKHLFMYFPTFHICCLTCRERDKYSVLRIHSRKTIDSGLHYIYT